MHYYLLGLFEKQRWTVLVSLSRGGKAGLAVEVDAEVMPQTGDLWHPLQGTRVAPGHKTH